MTLAKNRMERKTPHFVYFNWFWPMKWYFLDMWGLFASNSLSMCIIIITTSTLNLFFHHMYHLFFLHYHLLLYTHRHAFQHHNCSITSTIYYTITWISSSSLSIPWATLSTTTTATTWTTSTMSFVNAFRW